MDSENGSSGSVAGNPIQPRNKRPNPAKRWVFTWCNYPKNALKELLVPKFNSLGASYIIGKEIGKENLTPHLQGYVEFPNKLRPIETIRLPQIHWSLAMGNKQQNIEYCSKENDFITGGKFHQKPIIYKANPNTFHMWQKEIYDISQTEPDDRTIYWFYESEGNRGKSALVKYLCGCCKALCVSGKSGDIYYLILKYKETNGDFPTCIIYDIPRSSAGYINYGALEKVKDGCFASTKYECEMVVMNSPHFFCFANVEPDYEQCSSDRWMVKKI